MPAPRRDHRYDTTVSVGVGGKAEGSVSADRWRTLAASDGALDGREEELTLVVPRPSAPAFLSVRVVDASGNVSSVSAEYPAEFR